MTINIDTNELEWYGALSFFEEMDQLNYEEVAFGRGPWIRSERIVGIFAFYSSDRDIRTLETAKRYVGRPHTIGTFAYSYKEEEFKNLCKNMKIDFREKMDLKELINHIEKGKIITKIRKDNDNLCFIIDNSQSYQNLFVS